MDRASPTVCLVLCALVVLSLLATPAAAADDRRQVRDLTFPVVELSRFSDTYDANRAGGSRRHQATDIFGLKGQAVHAAVAGRVCAAPGIDEPMPSYGYIVQVCVGDVVYSYIHMNNDTPGTDDGRGGPGRAYAPGIRVGASVARGQLLGWLGDSGNAEDTEPHLHFSILDRALDDPAIAQAPWQPHYLDPYPSLVAARDRGDVPSGLLRLGQRGDQVAAWQRALLAAGQGDVVIDGIFGPGTDAATRRFQREERLGSDGVVGPATLAAMSSRLGQPVTVVAPTGGQPDPGVSGPGAGYAGRPLRLEVPMLRGDDVRAWQAQMRLRGWRGADGAPLAVDGYFGQDSDRAARLFQEERGLDVDGVVGPATWRAAFAGR